MIQIEDDTLYFESNPISCEICQKVFAAISTLKLHMEISHEEYISIKSKDKIKEPSPYGKIIDFSDVTFVCEGEQVMTPKEIFDYSEVKKEIEDTVCDNSDHFENNYSAMIFDLKMYSFSAMTSDDI